ncbi:MAG: dihydrofolate reductase family protein [Ilumatobacteraceae bacterium]
MIGDVRLVLPEMLPDVPIDRLYGVPRERLDGRPWVGLCMIASLDGSTVVDGRSGALGNATDSAVLGALRRAADTIVVGATTVRLESYGPPKKSGQRIGVVTSSGDVDPGTDLFTSGAGFLILPEDGPPAPVGPAGPVDVVRAGTGRADLALALRRLDELMDPPTFVQAEGGSRLNGSLLDADCVDELDLTLSPVLAGGDGARPVTGAHATLTRLRLAHLAADGDSFLYGRWTRP